MTTLFIKLLLLLTSLLYFLGCVPKLSLFLESKDLQNKSVAIVNYLTGKRFADGTYAQSCREYRFPAAGYRYNAEGSGVYTIDPDLEGIGAPVDVYCEMQMDGGGWTLVAHLDNYTQALVKNFSSAKSGNWFSGHLMGTGLFDFKIVAASSTESEIFSSNVPAEFNSTANFDVNITSANGSGTLSFLPNESQCGGSVPGNWQFYIANTAGTMLGFAGANSCGPGPVIGFILSPGSIDNGCTDWTQMPPRLAWPCSNTAPPAETGIKLEIYIKKRD